MNLYEKRVAQLEQKSPKHKYILERIPLTEKAKSWFGFENIKVTPANRLMVETLQAFMRSEHPLKFEYTFYYDDPNETEEERIQEVLKLSQNTHLIRGNSNSKPKYKTDYDVKIRKVNIE